MAVAAVGNLGRDWNYTGHPFAAVNLFGYGMTAWNPDAEPEDVIRTWAKLTFQLPQGRREALLAEMVDFNRRRAEKQPLTNFSAGSTFKRPPEGYVAQMIDECGLKGCSIGGAQVSEKHAGFLINKGGTAADFLALMAHVQHVVQQEKGVLLQPEVRILGEDAPVSAI